jgi:hypothetical protein
MAGARCEQVIYRAQNAGLAGTRRPDQTDEFPRGNFEANSFDNRFLPITQGEI